MTPTPPRVGDGPVRVLFVCVENANRSQMAEAFARIHGGSVVQPESAGSRPAVQVNPRAIAAMAERGYDLTGHQPKSVDAVRHLAWDRVVTMGCGDACPWVPAADIEDWPLPDPRDLGPEGVRAVRDEIERRVIELLGRLGGGSAGARGLPEAASPT